MDWRPIETAPKDGTEVLLYGRPPHKDDLTCYVGRWGTWDSAGGPSDCWISGGPHYRPTHWMPLPAPPDSPSS